MRGTTPVNAHRKEENLFIGRMKDHQPPAWKKHPTHDLKLIRFIPMTGQTQEVMFFASDQRDRYLKAQREEKSARRKSEKEAEAQW